jgi:hypothetical protein
MSHSMADRAEWYIYRDISERLKNMPVLSSSVHKVARFVYFTT